MKKTFFYIEKTQNSILSIGYSIVEWKSALKKLWRRPLNPNNCKRNNYQRLLD
ncbi:hypothetical protein [Cellulophaga sp. Hel_I_12]|uniref:hypothetical protein n=1 Tax=Cellulophaga sp. Hel_I_12 TaxID=1249972 RepID=UPI000A85D418|nr:hypothetical protein [Cellulophaga sp. Hel_I_12]